MKRDFTEAAQKEISKYVDDIERGIFWRSIGDGVLDIYYNLMKLFCGGNSITRVMAMKELWDIYHSSVIEAKNNSIKTINGIFEGAREADHDFAVRARNRVTDGEYLLTELQKITDIAHNRTLERVGSLAPLTISLKISDAELMNWLKETSYTSLGYSNAVMYTSDCFLSMGITTAMLAGVFHYKNILKTDVFDTPNGNAILNAFKQDILNGTCPYITIPQIAQRLGLTEDEVRRILDNSYANRSRGYDMKFSYGESKETLAKKIEYQKKCDRLLKQELESLFSDEEQFEEFCKKYAIDYTPEAATAVLNGEVDGYTVGLYQSTIMSTLETCVDRQDVTVYPDEVKDFIKAYGFVYQTAYRDGVDISNLSDKEIVAKITEYLKSEMGYKEVTSRDVELCELSTNMLQGLDEADKIGGYTQDGVELLSYLVADYSNEMQLLDSIEKVGAGSPEFQTAMNNIRTIYTDKASTIVNEVVKESLVKGSEKVAGSITAELLPSMKIVELGISVTGNVSGLTSYTDAAQDVIGYSMVCPELVDMYDNAVKVAAEEGYNQTSMVNVRNAFSMMKQSLLSYYDKQIKYSDGYLWGAAGSDKDYQSYIKYERAKLESLQLGQEYKPITYSAYKEKFGIG